MKKINRLSNIFFFSFVIILIIVLIILFNIFEKRMNHVINKIDYSQDEIIVYDPPADWATVSQDPLQPQKIDRELKGHFIDPETNSCFFLVMKMFGYNVDIDKYYLDFFGEKDQKIEHSGKISPYLFYQYSLVYMDAYDINLSVKDISDKDINYILAAGKNNYPIVVWYGGDDWIASNTYIIYSVKNNIIYMYNLDDKLEVDINTFKKNYSGYAIIYGKYW